MRIADALHRAARALRATVDRFRRRATGWALAVGLPFVATCQPAERSIPIPAAPPAPRAAAVVAVAPTPVEQPIGGFRVTMYYIAAEDEIDGPRHTPRVVLDDVTAANDNDDDDDTTLAAIGDVAPVPDLVPMFGKDCQPLVHVSPAFAKQARMQGTGRLRDGRLINVAGKCPCAGMCFHIPPKPREWGTGGSGKPLIPFRMVAVDPRIVKMGSLLYLPDLDGMRMPGRAPHGGFIHDGCVVAADTGGGIKGREIDLFVGRKAYVAALARRGGSHAWLRNVSVWSGVGRCTQGDGKVTRSAAGST